MQNELKPSNNVSDFIVNYLEWLQIDYVFGVPGGHITAFYEALAENKQGPRAILTRHETGAANMADGYARETGKLGICCATTGPGVTNLITGVASAYIDHTPLLVLTGQTPVPKFGMAAFQESSPDVMDTSAMLSHCTYYSSIISHPAQLEYKLTKALITALHYPRGPVHLSLPVDLSRAPINIPQDYNPPALLKQSPAMMDVYALDKLQTKIEKTLLQGQKLAILVGHHASGASIEIQTFAELTNTKVITTQRGKTWFDPFHPLAHGVFGYAGHTSARQVLEDPEVQWILAVGTSLGQWSTSTWDAALLNKRLIHIHPISDYFARSPMASLHVQGDITLIFKQLNNFLRTYLSQQVNLSTKTSLLTYQDEIIPSNIKLMNTKGYQTEDQIPIHPQSLIYALMQSSLPSQTRFIVDTTNWLPWTIHYFFPHKAQNYRLSSELAAMGWGLGAAVGTAIANRENPVICLAGDGGMLMAGQELTVAVQEKLTIIYIILNDQSYGMVKHRHRQISQVPLEFTVPAANFNLMAQAMGAQGYRIENIKDFYKVDIAQLCQYQGPTVLDIVIDPEVVPPMGMF